MNALQQIRNKPAKKTSQLVRFVKVKRDTLEVAKQKVLAKIAANKHYWQNGGEDRPDPIYIKQPNGLYAIGIKYGKRWLTDAFDGATFYQDIEEQDLHLYFDGAKECVELGIADEPIKVAMQANIDMHKAKNKSNEEAVTLLIDRIGSTA